MSGRVLMANDMIFGKGKKKNRKASDFNWMDDEIQLLLEVCFDFKAESDYEGVNWESKHTKYEQIKLKFCEQYPEVEDEKLPRSNHLDSITKERVSARLKSIRTNFQKAVDTGRRSGRGRIIFTFYELCERIWDGCPAVNSISQGIDTSIHKIKNKKNREMRQCKTNYRMNKIKMMMRAAVFSQTRYFQNMMKTVLEAQQVVKKFEKPNPLKNKQQTVLKR